MESSYPVQKRRKTARYYLTKSDPRGDSLLKIRDKEFNTYWLVGDRFSDDDLEVNPVQYSLLKKGIEQKIGENTYIKTITAKEVYQVKAFVDRLKPVDMINFRVAMSHKPYVLTKKLSHVPVGKALARFQDIKTRSIWVLAFKASESKGDVVVTNVNDFLELGVGDRIKVGRKMFERVEMVPAFFKFAKSLIPQLLMQTGMISSRQSSNLVRALGKQTPKLSILDESNPMSCKSLKQCGDMDRCEAYCREIVAEIVRNLMHIELRDTEGNSLNFRFELGFDDDISIKLTPSEYYALSVEYNVRRSKFEGDYIKGEDDIDNIAIPFMSRVVRNFYPKYMSVQNMSSEGTGSSFCFEQRRDSAVGL